MESTGIVGALVTAFTSAASEMTGAIEQIVPVAIPVVTTMLIVTIGVKAFKKFTK